MPTDLRKAILLYCLHSVFLFQLQLHAQFQLIYLKRGFGERKNSLQRQTNGNSLDFLCYSLKEHQFSKIASISQLFTQHVIVHALQGPD